MNDVVEQGRHLAKVFDGENRVEHLTLFLALRAYDDGATSDVSAVSNQSCGSPTQRAQ